MTFENLNLIKPLLSALEKEGYTKPTPIQEKAIPIVLNKRDLLGCAQTGTGKTAAFALPILQLHYEESIKINQHRLVKTLILTPTRELAIQIGESFSSYGKFLNIRHCVIFGGVPQRAQTDRLKVGCDILIATPGRLLDLMNQGYIRLENINKFVLDEADRMLDMGFINDVKKIITKLPHKRQTLLFSATMPDEIAKLADKLLTDPEKAAVTPVSSTVDTISQSLYFVKKSDKRSLLIHLIKENKITSALVFTRTKHGANKVSDEINKAGILSDAIHGNKTQNARQRALTDFKNKRIRVLVATDIAARGIDIDELPYVFNFDLPEVPETYVHRIGRTGRAGLSGKAISFCDHEEKDLLKGIYKLLSRTIDTVDDHPFVMSVSNDEIGKSKFYIRTIGTKTHDKTDNYRTDNRHYNNNFKSVRTGSGKKNDSERTENSLNLGENQRPDSNKRFNGKKRFRKFA